LHHCPQGTGFGLHAGLTQYCNSWIDLLKAPCHWRFGRE